MLIFVCGYKEGNVINGRVIFSYLSLFIRIPDKTHTQLSFFFLLSFEVDYFYFWFIQFLLQQISGTSLDSLRHSALYFIVVRFLGACCKHAYSGLSESRPKTDLFRVATLVERFIL